MRVVLVAKGGHIPTSKSSNGDRYAHAILIFKNTAAVNEERQWEHKRRGESSAVAWFSEDNLHLRVPV